MSDADTHHQGGDDALEQAYILVVDNDEDGRMLVSRILKRQGYRVENAADGRDAVGKVEGGRVDLIVLDVMMPEMDGYAVYRHLRESDRTRHIPIIMLTALNQSDQVERALNILPDWYITKPFDAGYLLKRVRQVLFNSHNPRPLTL